MIVSTYELKLAASLLKELAEARLTGEIDPLRELEINRQLDLLLAKEEVIH